MTILAFLAGVAATIAAFALLRAHCWGFRAQKPRDYVDEGPELDLREALAGRLRVQGMVFDYTGRMNSRFDAVMNGVREGDEVRISETFEYDSGAVDTRDWKIEFGADGRFTATATDIVGVAEGVMSGPTAQMRYRIRLPERAGGHVLDVTDWMYLTPQGTILNRSEMRKFGVKAAELIAVMERETDDVDG